ncbi:MAG: F0F1 ATP synthase subunit B [Gammaproteobacteria bacterium]|nr:F0F1 ATP synthase subunit B [Gammaproteobacteria bacterium]MCY4165244.1 F0F1 ATP synthase subunit B [Gammaproteobacteria bacterium]MCY4256051.1 F0F1 ATP synthase subunit B [Gammaproteobacteria bacterium]MCY4340729.1 F0F1 ATP synthase subunit B [Gammaproteobacteria bacterium]
MNINATLLAQVLVFAALVWFTMKFIWPQVIDAIDKRNKEIADGLEAAERGRSELAASQDRIEKLVGEARGQASEIIDQANGRAARIVEEAREEGERERQRLVAAAHSEIERETSQARDELRGQVAALAIAGAEKILLREIDASAHGEMLKRFSARI